jgi:aerobic carbon-monoxide dehydrogenase large subunit
MPLLKGDEAARLVAGRAPYLADLDLGADALEVAFVRSPLPHAAIRSVGGEQAATASDLGLQPLAIEGPGLRPRPWHALARERVRYLGEPVAAVWAGDRYRAEDLAARVRLDLEELPLEDPAELFSATFSGGDPDAAFGRAERVLEGSFRAARQTPLPLEGRGVAAAWDAESGRIRLWTSTQVPSLVRTGVARCLGIEEDRLQVLVPRVGGGFGLKAHLFAEEVVLAALAMRLRRPVRWVEDRWENLVASAHAHDTEVRLRVGVDGDGRVLAVDAEVTADVGAYSIYPFSASLEPMTAAQTLFGPYAIEALRFRARGLASNRCPVGAYRGVGMNAAVHATERMMDVIAAALAIDPLELRRRNVHGSLPVETVAGRRLDSGDYPELLRRLEEESGYAGLRRRQAEARAEGRLVGIGIGVFNEHAGAGAGDYRRRGVSTIPGHDAARVRVGGDGRIVVHTSAADAGQGHAETYREVAARELGVPPDRVDVVEGDTDACPPGTGTFTSRGAVGVLESVVQALRAAAEADLAPGTDVTRTVDASQVFPSGAHLAVVEVDPVSLVPRVVRYVAVEDCGTVVHRDVVEGQVRGGVAMGIGNVLFEEHVHGPDGQILTATMQDYLVPLAADVPEVEMAHLESPSPRTSLGSKGAGEAGTVGACGAVANAVADAVRPLGGRELDRLPYSPARIFESLQPSS